MRTYLLSVILLCIYLGSVHVQAHQHIQHDHKCISHDLYKDFKEVRVNQSYPSSKLRTTPQPIRILADTSLVTTADPRSCSSAGSYVQIGNPSTSAPNPTCGSTYSDCWYLCTANDVVTTTKRDLIADTLMPTAVDMFAAFLKVIPVTGNLKLSSGTCGANGGVSVPSSYVSPGLANTDIVLFVTARPAEPSVLAWAIECRSDNVGRAIAGQVNIAPASVPDPAQADYYIRVVLHEIMHVLGFNSQKFSSFINPATNQVLPVTSIKQTASGPKGGSITQIITPKALQYAREYFGCPTLAGVSIEDGGGSGSAGSHWEKRIFWDDIMNPSASRPQVISKVTLGLLEDMGWYYPDYSIAEVSNWGRNQGCQFPTGYCSQWTQPGTFCSATGDVCSMDYRSLAYCSISQYSSSLPQQYQWFSDPSKGGNDQFVDYCPLVTPYSNGDCTVADSNAQNANNNKLYYGSLRGSSSRCFDGTLTNKSYVANSTPRVNCYPTRCVSNALQVAIADTYYSCPVEGGRITSVSSFNGYITCPPSSVVCASSSSATTPATSSPATTPATSSPATPPPTPGAPTSSPSSTTPPSSVTSSPTLSPTPLPATQAPTAGARRYLFQDELASDWTVAGTSSTSLCGAGAPPSSCSVSASLAKNGYIQFSNKAVDGALGGILYASLYFSAKASSTTEVTLTIGQYSAKVQIGSSWVNVNAPLSIFGSPAKITSITFKNTGTSTSTISLDNVYLSP